MIHIHIYSNVFLYKVFNRSNMFGNYTMSTFLNLQKFSLGEIAAKCYHNHHIFPSVCHRLPTLPTTTKIKIENKKYAHFI